MTIFTRERTEQMGTGFAVFGYGCALGGAAAAFFAPFVLHWLADMDINWYEYPIMVISLLQLSLMLGFVWGGLCGATLGALVNLQWLFNTHPKIARLISALCIMFPTYAIASTRMMFVPAAAISALFMACVWVIVGYLSLYFIDRELQPISKFDLYIQEFNEL